MSRGFAAAVLNRNCGEAWFVPDAGIIHFEGASAGKTHGLETWLQYIPLKLLFLRNNGCRAFIPCA